MIDPQDIQKMPMARLLFEKIGRAKYISHLDLNRCFSRAFKRSNLPIWHTQGFNPHVYINFALPISLGYESLCESMDVRLLYDIDFDMIKDNLNAHLPMGLKVVSAGEIKMKSEEIAWASYNLHISFDNMENIEEKWNLFVNQNEIIVEKKGKKGRIKVINQVDIKPHIKTQSVRVEDEMICDICLAAGISVNINPSLLINAFCAAYSLSYDKFEVIRSAILTDNLTPFI